MSSGAIFRKQTQNSVICKNKSFCIDYQYILHFTTQSRIFNDLEKEALRKNIEGKGENAGNEHFSFFPQCFYPSPKEFCFHFTFILSSADAFNLDQPKNLLYRHLG